jgi:hypothetical protein
MAIELSAHGGVVSSRESIPKSCCEQQQPTSDINVSKGSTTSLLETMMMKVDRNSKQIVRSLMGVPLTRLYVVFASQEWNCSTTEDVM